LRIGDELGGLIGGKLVGFPLSDLRLFGGGIDGRSPKAGDWAGKRTDDKHHPRNARASPFGKIGSLLIIHVFTIVPEAAPIPLGKSA